MLTFRSIQEAASKLALVQPITIDAAHLHAHTSSFTYFPQKSARPTIFPSISSLNPRLNSVSEPSLKTARTSGFWLMGKLEDRWQSVTEERVLGRTVDRGVLIRAARHKVVHNSRLNPCRDYGYAETAGSSLLR